MCTRCKKCTPLKEQTSVFTDKEQLLCSKIYLSCFKYKIITEPLGDLKVNSGTIHIKDIARKLSEKSYGKVYEFMQDMNSLIKSGELPMLKSICHVTREKFRISKSFAHSSSVCSILHKESVRTDVKVYKRHSEAVPFTINLRLWPYSFNYY
ncbi:hypothetical protein DdX_11637 [Ditylenchus destructor]|uniref:Uncharacterized protein n=1 Tax=Ditylenchus destructor TaxID=166010 RepID=A0AAD4MZ34_9BILA|nr:hypothetical protein DdX_11637 [Ditylenchus destructor]